MLSARPQDTFRAVVVTDASILFVHCDIYIYVYLLTRECAVLKGIFDTKEQWW